MVCSAQSLHILWIAPEVDLAPPAPELAHALGESARIECARGLAAAASHLSGQTFDAVLIAPSLLQILLSQATPAPSAPSGQSGEELERLSRQATTDPLTGLLRREEMTRRTEAELERAAHAGQSLVCVMADIDHFKRVNDVFGHQTGDRTLREVASLLAGGCRPSDLAGRMGGEEFMLILPGPSLEEGQRVAERLRLQVQDFNWKASALPSVTISLGVAEWREDRYASLAALIQAADQALYEAKRHGRNQVWAAGASRAEKQPVKEERTDPARDQLPRLLLVDDAPLYLNELTHLLGGRYQTRATGDPLEALAWLEKEPFDLILTDQNMPGLRGHELLARAKSLQPHCMRVIMTSHGELGAAIQAINEGEVYRFVLKPWNDEELLMLVHQALEHRAMVERLRGSSREALKVLAESLEARDRRTRGHYLRVAELSLRLGAGLGYGSERRQLLEYAAWLHDIGKIGLPDTILRKSAPLGRHDEKMLREHPRLGAGLVASVEHLALVAPAIRHHHERFDGHGFPDGLRGSAIPEEARILAIANAYDGLLSPRDGRPPLPPAEALANIQSGAGTRFDPELVKLFERLMKEIK